MKFQFNVQFHYFALFILFYVKFDAGHRHLKVRHKWNFSNLRIFDLFLHWQKVGLLAEPIEAVVARSSCRLLCSDTLLDIPLWSSFNWKTANASTHLTLYIGNYSFKFSFLTNKFLSAEGLFVVTLKGVWHINLTFTWRWFKSSHTQSIKSFKYIFFTFGKNCFKICCTTKKLDSLIKNFSFFLFTTFNSIFL